jgi:hypothetical protein
MAGFRAILTGIRPPEGTDKLRSRFILTLRAPFCESPLCILGETGPDGNSIIDSAPDAGLQRMKVETISRLVPILHKTQLTKAAP